MPFSVVLALIAMPVHAACTLDPSIAPVYEEQRLVNRLPGNDTPFARRIVQAAGFEGRITAFADSLCRDGSTAIDSFDSAHRHVAATGRDLWRAAVDRAQGRVIAGMLPASDDRPLYWTRLAMTRLLRQWRTPWLNETEKTALIREFERASRGQYDVTLPPGRKIRRMIVSGFDPFALGEPGASGTAIRTGNPSGALALTLDGREVPLPDGSVLRIETYLLPVSFAPFADGVQEDTLGPWFLKGPSRVDASLTVSQGIGYQFNLEAWNGRYHGGTFPGNDGKTACAPDGAGRPPGPQGCDITPPERWSGLPAAPWKADSPPQFTASTLPVARMLAANTGAGIRRPPGDLATGEGAFDVTWNVSYSVFPDCERPGFVVLNRGLETMNRLPSGKPVAPPKGSCAREGGGGNYLSNESAYRNTLLRDAMKLSIPAGHIHTPVMNRFAPGGDGRISDEVFETYRDAIVRQAERLVMEVGKSLAER
ncbi:hypothetical protein GCM10011289_15810 [Paludibacterium paludis]|uniref:Pyrrolidone-carboxylate peptidase n=2 Tax=Paludibacterium paludis TaxID=1225769 RepID=A0A918U9S5_9NEIS|nr:hypothetical protein GCM10011289_15810 [Paludibacterium paludis]